MKKLLLIAVLVALLGIPMGASMAQDQKVSWEIYRIDTSADGAAYLEVHCETGKMLIREDERHLYASPLEANWLWSAETSVILATSPQGELWGYRLDELANPPANNIVGPFVTNYELGAYLEGQFENGSFLIASEQRQQWLLATPTESGLDFTTIVPFSAQLLGIHRNQVAYSLEGEIYAFDATTHQHLRLEMAWPPFVQDTLQVPRLAQVHNGTWLVIQHYLIHRETADWKLISGLVDGQLEVGYVYHQGKEDQYYIGVNSNPLLADRLFAQRDGDLLIARDLTVHQCRIDANGIACERVVDLGAIN